MKINISCIVCATNSEIRAGNGNVMIFKQPSSNYKQILWDKTIFRSLA